MSNFLDYTMLDNKIDLINGFLCFIIDICIILFIDELKRKIMSE